MVDGTKLKGPGDLRRALLSRSDSFMTSVTERLMTYALGRRVEFYDMPAVREIIRDAAKSENRFSAFILGVAKSKAFQMSRAEKVETTDAVR